MMIRTIVNGAGGRMGARVVALLDASEQHVCVGAVDAYAEEFIPSLKGVSEDADGIIDFSSHLATHELLAYACEKKLPVVIATTGHTESELEAIKQAARSIPIFLSANMSVGVAVTVNLAKQVAAVFPDADIEIVEKHHNQKMDAPSGTALMIANAIREVREGCTLKCSRAGVGKREKSEIGIHALRMGGVIGEHEVFVVTPSQTISIKHEAHTRDLFAEGALAALSFLVGKKAGLYDMYDLLG